MSPKTFTQNPLEYLAGAVLWQLGFREVDAAWNFVIGERSPAMRDQLILAERFSRLQRYASHHDFAPLLIGYSEDRHFTNRGKLVNNRFDLTGVDVFSARNDHVLQAVQDVEIPVRILIADVTGTKHPILDILAILECSCRFFRLIPVTARDISAPGHQFTMLSDSNFLPRLVDYPHVDPGTSPPTRHEPVLRVFMVLQTSEKARFGQTVALNKFKIG